MNTTTDIKDHFGTLYYAKSALVFYETKGTENDMYVEHFDMDSNGTPINAHPLTVEEANILAKSLQTDEEKNQAFLKPKGILPTNILRIIKMLKKVRYFGTPKHNNGNCILWIVWAYLTEWHKYRQCYG